MIDRKFDFNDISLKPEVLSSIVSRKDVDTGVTGEHWTTLPLMVSPMDTVIDNNNYHKFENEGFVTCMPRNQSPVGDSFLSMSLEEFDNYVTLLETLKSSNIELVNKDNTTHTNIPHPMKILVDVANGHMNRLYNLSASFMTNKYNEKQELMVGNIANPDTYKQYAMLSVDYIRVGIGAGSGCLTSANTSIHYPMASLIKECYDVKKEYGFTTKIVADGGFRNFDDIIKALALGADYVMLGGLLNKSLEACGDTYLFGININKYKTKIWNNFPFLRKRMKRKFRGMSTKEVQKKWNRKELVTSEGISKYNNVEFTIEGWTNNFLDYLRSAMSYTNSHNLREFKDSNFIFISDQAYKRYNK